MFTFNNLNTDRITFLNFILLITCSLYPIIAILWEFIYLNIYYTHYHCSPTRTQPISRKKLQTKKPNEELISHLTCACWALKGRQARLSNASQWNSLGRYGEQIKPRHIKTYRKQQARKKFIITSLSCGYQQAIQCAAWM